MFERIHDEDDQDGEIIVDEEKARHKEKEKEPTEFIKPIYLESTMS